MEYSINDPATADDLLEEALRLFASARKHIEPRRGQMLAEASTAALIAAGIQNRPVPRFRGVDLHDTE